MKRTDTHRPSALRPHEYSFVAMGCEPNNEGYHYSVVQHELEKLKNFMALTGAKFSTHDHGGSCHICGAHCVYDAIFYHKPTNELIRTGMDCAAKLNMGDTAKFRTFRKHIADARKRAAGKAKAQAVLADHGFSQAWEVYLSELNDQPRDNRYWLKNVEYYYFAVKSMVGNLIKYGSMSDKQFKFMGTCLGKLNTWEETYADLKALEADVPAIEAGRYEITGKVISTKWQENNYNYHSRGCLKMLVVADNGQKFWGTAPSSIEAEVEKGSQIRLTATVTPSDDDPKFSFYKRPSKAELITTQA